MFAFGNLLIALLLSPWLTACNAQPAREPGAYGGPASNYFEGKALELAEALDRNDAADVRRLIKQEGVNPDVIFDESAMPMVAWPVFSKNLPGLKLLLDNGADPDARRVDAQRVSGQRRNNALVLAAGEADPRYLAMLLKYGGDPNTYNSNGETLTHVAFLRDQWNNVQLLVENGANINEGLYVPDDYDTVASWYSGMGDFDKVYWLLQHGADPTKKMIAPALSPNEGRMPILESIFWLPVKPRMIEWQKKCQRMLTERGIRRPPMPAYLKQKRLQLDLPTDEEDIPLL